MGQQARAKRVRRGLVRQDVARLQELNEQARAPEVQARVAAFHDAECQRIKDRDRPGQLARLTAQGWQERTRNRDGIGVWDHRRWRLRLIHTVAREQDGGVWGHVSVSTAERTMPTWAEARDVGWVLYPGQFGIIVVAPQDKHVSISEVAHIWYRLDGAPSCPDFSHGFGSI
jgi:hypothetical protein